MPQYFLQTGTVPSETTIPVTAQGFIDLFGEYLEVASAIPIGNATDISIVETLPQTPDDKVYVKTNNSRPIGVYAYGPDGFYPMSLARSGNKDDAPTPAEPGEQYYATDIRCMLMYDSQEGWITQDGQPGDVKFVWIDPVTFDDYTKGSTEALRRNPGWEIYTDAAGRALVSTSSSDYPISGNQFGLEEVSLSEEQIADHKHGGLTTVSASLNGTINGGGSANFLYVGSSLSPGIEEEYDFDTVGDAGDVEAHENRPPSITAFCLRKKGY